MPKKLIKPGILLATVFVVISLLFTTVGATTVEVLDGKVSIADTANTVKNSNGTITATAKGGMLSKKSNTITITNETSDTATISFEYKVEKSSSFTIDGATAVASGSYSKILNSGDSVVLVITSNSGFSNLTVTLTITNLRYAKAAASSNVTIEYDSTLGSVTAGGEAVASGGSKDATLTDGIELVATPVSGATFVGWANTVDNSVISTAASYTLTPSADMTVKAIFGSASKPCFGVGAEAQKSESSGLLGFSKIYYYQAGISYLFDDLNAAANFAASSSTNKAVVLMNDGTLSAGTYTIPAGVTLLIPFDSANTMYTEQVQNTGTYTTPTAFRTLTMADGANLVLNGSMSLSAMQRYAAGSKTDGGSPTGAVSFVKMQGDSSITVNKGGTLYAYGFITGSGSVTVNSGATVYECFQFMDFRGGTQSTDMKNGVFPLCQYYVQNIEVPMTLYSGAEEHAYTTIYMSSADFGSDIKFIANSDAMFNLTNGYAVKRYDGSTDRMIIELYGDVTVSSIDMSVGTSSINSEKYELPINSNITVTAKSGSSVTISQDLAFLPGSVMEIEEGATCTLGSDTNVYIYDADQWGTYCGAKDKTFVSLTYAPGRTYTRTDADLVDAKILVNGTFDASAGYLYTTAGGANICSTGAGIVKLQKGTETVTYQLIQASKTYVEIPITPAKLKNADGKYVSTQNDIQGVVEYKYVNGVWQGVLKVYKDSTVSDENSGVMIQYRTESYLWLNASCYVKFLKDKDGALLADGVLSVTSGGVTNTYDLAKQTFTTNDGVQIVMSGDAVYIVKKIVAKEIPDEIKFTISYVDAEANVTFVSEVVTADFKTDMAGDPVGDAYIQYGTAAKDYFDGDTTLSSGSVPENPVKNGATVTTTGAPVAWNGATLETTGANIYFDEALRLGISYDLSTIPSGYKIEQIGLLVGDYGIENLILDNASKAYLMYDLLDGETVDGVVINNEALSGVSSNNRPWDKDGNVINVTPDPWQTPDDLMAGTIIFDLAAQDYKTMFAIRPVIVLEKEGSYVCVYGRQIGYGLEAYINGVYAEASDEYKYLLEMTWALAGVTAPATGG